MAWGLRFGVWGLGCGVWGLGLGVWGLGFGVRGLVFGVWGAEFRFRVMVYGRECKQGLAPILGLKIWDLECRV